MWVAPWTGPNGEIILVATRRDNRRIAERELQFGDDHVSASDELWALVELYDPEPMLKVI